MEPFELLVFLLSAAFLLGFLTGILAGAVIFSATVKKNTTIKIVKQNNNQQ